MTVERAIILITTLLLLAGGASAAKHHENYDEAELDLAILQTYIERILSTLNGTLASCRDLEAEQAVSQAVGFSDMVLGAKVMMEGISKEVDSYTYLLGYMDGLSKVESNLTLMVDGLSRAIWAAENLTSVPSFIWEKDPLRECLTRTDEALTDLKSGLDSFEGALPGLVLDLERLSLLEIDVSAQMAFANGLYGSRSNISADLIGPWEITAALMHHPLDAWGQEISKLLGEGPIDGEVSRSAEVLGSVLPFLGGGLLTPIRTVHAPLSSAGSHLGSFQYLQSSFLAAMERLKATSGPGGDLGSRLVDFEVCRASISGMGYYLDCMHDASALLDMLDTSEVDDGLSELGELLEGYRSDLSSIDLIGDRFRRIAGMVNETFWSNDLEADVDGDGTISFLEAASIELGDAPLMLVMEMEREMGALERDLFALPDWVLTDMRAPFVHLVSLVRSASRFTRSHQWLIENLSSLIPIGRSIPPVEDLSLCFLHLSTMRSALWSVPDLVMGLRSHRIVAKMSFFADLESLIGLYSDLLLRIGRMINETLLLISVLPEEVPFDTSVQWSAVLLTRNEAGEVVLSDGDPIEIILDNTSLGTFTTDGGSISGSLAVSRSMSVGEHGLEAVHRSAVLGYVSARDVFSIRRLETFVLLEAPTYSLLPDEIVDIGISARDELLRPYSGLLLLDGERDSIAGWTSRERSYPSLGRYRLEAEVPDGEHFSGSSASLSFNVSTEPIIYLEVPLKEVFEGDEITVWLVVERGEGVAHLHVDGPSISALKMGNGSRQEVSINSSGLGLGRHLFQAYLLTTVPWGRSGWSGIVVVDVAAPEDVDEVLPPLPDENISWGDEETSFWDDLFPDWGLSDLFGAGLFRWTILAVIVIGALSLTVYMVVKFRKGPKGQGPVLPRIHLRRKGSDRPEAGSGPTGPTGGDRTSQGGAGMSGFTAHFYRDGPSREELIRLYLDILERSPEGVGLKRSMTPREVANRMEALGFDKEVAKRLALNFELSIYMSGEPDGRALSEFREDKGRASAFMDALARRLSSVLSLHRGGGRP